MVLISLVARGFVALKCLLYIYLYQMYSSTMHTENYKELIMKRYLDVVLPGLFEQDLKYPVVVRRLQMLQTPTRNSPIRQLRPRYRTRWPHDNYSIYPAVFPGFYPQLLVPGILFPLSILPRILAEVSKTVRYESPILPLFEDPVRDDSIWLNLVVSCHFANFQFEIENTEGPRCLRATTSGQCCSDLP